MHLFCCLTLNASILPGPVISTSSLSFRAKSSVISSDGASCHFERSPLSFRAKSKNLTSGSTSHPCGQKRGDHLHDHPFSLWEQRESNPRPSACKADALNQLSYTPDERNYVLWEQRESNPRPSACKADALNQLSYTPKNFKRTCPTARSKDAYFRLGLQIYDAFCKRQNFFACFLLFFRQEYLSLQKLSSGDVLVLTANDIGW